MGPDEEFADITGRLLREGDLVVYAVGNGTSGGRLREGVIKEINESKPRKVTIKGRNGGRGGKYYTTNTHVYITKSINEAKAEKLRKLIDEKK